MRPARAVRLRLTAAAAALAALGACGSGGSSSSPASPAHLSLEPQSSFSDDDMRHLLARTHFGVNLAELAQVRALGVPAYVDRMLVFPAVGSQPFEQQAETLLYNPNDPPGLQGGFPLPYQLVNWWLRLMEDNPNPFQEVMALFWHDHFAVSSAVLFPGARHWMREHIDLLRGGATGNLRTLLVDVARDEAMLTWLDGVQNTATAPNENFAREFWELFTLGVDNGYTQQDITEAARAFTGYQSIAGPNGQALIRFNTNLHDAHAKTVLGVRIAGQNTHDDYEAVVDITLQQGPVAEFICTKILEHFCYENPPQSVVNQLAATLRASNWELRPVLQKLFKSRAFYSSAAKTGLVKSPLEHAIGFVRATGMRVRLGLLADAVGAMGQTPSQPPTVEGWAEGEFWLGAQGIVERANFLAVAVSERAYQSSLGYDVASLLPPPGQRSSSEVVDWLSDLMRIRPTSAERTLYVQYLDTQRLGNGSVVSSPFNPSSSAHLDERLRGLLYVLGQHPSYAIR